MGTADFNNMLKTSWVPIIIHIDWVKRFEPSFDLFIRLHRYHPFPLLYHNSDDLGGLRKQYPEARRWNDWFKHFHSVIIRRTSPFGVTSFCDGLVFIDTFVPLCWFCQTTYVCSHCHIQMMWFGSHRRRLSRAVYRAESALFAAVLGCLVAQHTNQAQRLVHDCDPVLVFKAGVFVMPKALKLAMAFSGILSTSSFSNVSVSIIFYFLSVYLQN